MSRPNFIKLGNTTHPEFWGEWIETSKFVGDKDDTNVLQILQSGEIIDDCELFTFKIKNAGVHGVIYLIEKLNDFEDFKSCKNFHIKIFPFEVGTNEKEDKTEFLDIKNGDIIGLKRNKTQNEITIIVNDVKCKTFEIPESFKSVKLFPTIAYKAHV